MRGLVLTALFIAVVFVPASVASRATADATVWNIVALGDSDTTGEGDATGLGWVGRYARLLRQRLGLTVTVTNLARGGLTSHDLLAELRSDPFTGDALGTATIVLVGIGGADLNAGDLANEAGTCKGSACYATDLRSFGRNVDRIAATVRNLRSRNEAVLRAITLPNVVPGAEGIVPPFITFGIGVYQTKTLKRYVCAAMSKHQGRCVDALTAFNGPAMTRNAYAKGLLTKNPCCYPNGKGQQLIAELVFKSGLAPLR
jgi:lysophospholipase L1-like esterase